MGIDPSINSTGVCLMDENNNTEFFIIKPNKLKKEEQKALDNILNLNYLLYDKIDLTIYKDNNHLSEYYKTINILNIVKSIKDIIHQKTILNNELYILMEGISYGSSMKTKSIYDLAGLNFLIRNACISSNLENTHLIIAPPSEIKKFASGNGNCQKDVINNLFMCIFPEFNEYKIKIDDISDAYFMSQASKIIYEKESQN